MHEERIHFPGALGAQLAARLHHPTGRARAYALFAHCFTCSKDLRAAVRLSRALAEQGVATLRFDFTGLGESEGDFADTSFSSNVDDLVAAADYLRSRYEAPRLLVGHSLGGSAVVLAAGRVTESVAVATIGAPFEPSHVRKWIDEQAPDLAERGTCRVTLAGRSFTVKKQLLDDLESQRGSQAIASLGRALLIFHSPQDQVVGIQNAQHIYVAARHPKSFVSLDGADHLLSRPADAEYVANVLSAWVSRYLPAADADNGAVAGAEPGLVVVRSESSGLAQDVTAGRHALRADEPVEVGGTDTGPNPYDYLLAGLGACTSMTLRMYATHKGWPLERVTVRLRHEKIHAKDCADCETKTGKVDRIERELVIEGALDAEQRGRLLEIADRCPVHRTLTSETKIVTTLA